MFALVAPLALLACQSGPPTPDGNAGPTPEPDQVMCTMEARSSISIAVLDAATGDSLGAMPTGTVREGAFEEALQGFGNQLAGPFERKGTYDVTVTAPGYASWDTTGVVVTADECHVQTVQLTVRLAPDA
jgi:hypothetical protein